MKHTFLILWFDSPFFCFKKIVLKLTLDNFSSSVILNNYWFSVHISQGRRKVWKSGGARSTVVGIICPPGWDTVNYFAKNWGGGTEAGVGGLGGIMGGGQPNRVNWHSTGSLIPSDSEFWFFYYTLLFEVFGKLYLKIA